MTDFQKRVFRTVVELTRKKGPCSVLDLRRTYFQYYSSSLIKNTLKVLVKDGAVRNRGGKYSAFAEVKGYQATAEDLE
ncbi:hypothetical protein FPC12_07005 [Salmonella enterica]|nr:hypothetical protein [Salmonella enterica]